MTSLITQVRVAQAAVKPSWVRDIAVIIEDTDGETTHVHLWADVARELVSDLAAALDEARS